MSTCTWLSSKWFICCQPARPLLRLLLDEKNIFVTCPYDKYTRAGENEREKDAWVNITQYERMMTQSHHNHRQLAILLQTNRTLLLPIHRSPLSTVFSASYNDRELFPARGYFCFFILSSASLSRPLTWLVSTDAARSGEEGESAARKRYNNNLPWCSKCDFCLLFSLSLSLSLPLTDEPLRWLNLLCD